ncbi:MAG TPA: TIGR00341 family protein [Bacteroidales bacterium]|nr:TIGR00341 family protein [Bacteroidales bacterium]
MGAKSVIRKVLHFFNLESELEEQDSVYEEIKKGIIFKGTNLWILIFAIIIASIGLNMNSTAVIIGAMLISPLMGPINGMGYSIATYDFELFKRSLKNFAFAIISSLVASTAYFALSPISTAHSELLARTSPTIYDVLIALFGGLAGIVAISSRQKGNVIPGVAIATALMPPLCTAGYGIATGQLDFFLGAFYLFTINTIFIAIASVWISQLLNFPIRTIIDEKKKKHINRIITLIISIVLLPSIFFGYKLVKQEEFIQKTNQYISGISNFEGNYLLNHKIDEKSHEITLVYGGTSLSDEQKDAIIMKAKDFGLEETIIHIEQGISLGNKDNEKGELFRLKEEIITLNSTLKKKKATLDSIQNSHQTGQVLLNEIQTIYPQIKNCSYSKTYTYSEKHASPTSTTIIVLTTKGSITVSEKAKINNWLKKRLNNEAVKVFYE